MAATHRSLGAIVFCGRTAAAKVTLTLNDNRLIGVAKVGGRDDGRAASDGQVGIGVGHRILAEDLVDQLRDKPQAGTAPYQHNRIDLGEGSSLAFSNTLWQHCLRVSMMS